MRLIYTVGKKEHRHFIEDCVRLDKVVYDEKYVGDIEIYKYIFDLNPNFFIFAIDADTSKLAGYFIGCGITSDSYNTMRTGQYVDTQLFEKRHLVQVKKFKDNKLYLYSIAVNPEYQGNGVCKNIIDTFMGQVGEYTSNGYYISNILGDAVNPKAFGNISKYNFMVVNTTDHNSVLIEKIYDNVHDADQKVAVAV